MKESKVCIILGVLIALLLTYCKAEEPPVSTVFTGYVIDENDKPVEGMGFLFFSDKKGFFKETMSDSNGYYFLEGIVPKNAGLISFETTYGNSKYTDGLYIQLCLVNGVYQKIIPWEYGKRNMLNFKIVKR